MEKTVDSKTWITKKENGWIYYENSDGKTWRVSGQCIACGLCENIREPGTYIETNITESGEQFERVLVWSLPAGQEGACVEIGYENRLDIPVTPDLMINIPKCTLTGEWL